MKNILEFKNFVKENYEINEISGNHSKDDLIESLLDIQTVYSKEDLENMNIDQLKDLYDEVVQANVEEINSKEPINQLEYESTKWIQNAIKRPGSLRRRLRKKEGEKITSSEIDSELQALRAKDKDKGKPGLQLSKRNRRKQKQLVLAKTLKGL